VARRKLSAIPWGNVSPAGELFSDVLYPIIEIDDATGAIYVGNAATSSGSIPDSVQSFSVNTTVTMSGSINSYVAGVGGSSGITLTLPSPAGSDSNGSFTGRVFKIKKTDSGAGSVTVSGSIDGSASYVLNNQYQYVILESDGAIWQVVGNN